MGTGPFFLMFCGVRPYLRDAIRTRVRENIFPRWQGLTPRKCPLSCRKSSLSPFFTKAIKKLKVFLIKDKLSNCVMDRRKKFNLDYSRIEFAADARHRVCGCGSSLQMPCNEADAVKSVRPKGKLCRHIIKRNALETD